MGNNCCSSTRSVVDDESEADTAATNARSMKRTAPSSARRRGAAAKRVEAPVAVPDPSLPSSPALAVPALPTSGDRPPKSIETPPAAAAPPPPAAPAAAVLPPSPSPSSAGGYPLPPTGAEAARSRRHRQGLRGSLTVADEFVTDTFFVSATTVSEDDGDTFSVELSQPTHSLLWTDRAGHMRTFSDGTSEVDFTASTVDRPHPERVFKLAARELMTVEAECRRRIARAARGAGRALFAAACRRQVMLGRASLLQRFFVERLALMLWETVAQEAVARAALVHSESADWGALADSSAASPVAAAAALKGGSSLSSQPWCCEGSQPGTRANGTTTDVDLTSTGSFDEEEASNSAPRHATPVSSLRLTTSLSSGRPRGSSGPIAHRVDDLATNSSSTERRTSATRRRRASSAAAIGGSDARRIVRDKHAAKVQQSSSATHFRSRRGWTE